MAFIFVTFYVIVYFRHCHNTKKYAFIDTFHLIPWDSYISSNQPQHFKLQLWSPKYILEGESWILHTNVRTIERLELNTWTNRTLIGNQIGAIAVDYHYTQGYIYWADQTDDRIQR